MYAIDRKATSNLSGTHREINEIADDLGWWTVGQLAISTFHFEVIITSIA